MIESPMNEEKVVDAYNELFNSLLLERNISMKRIFQSFSIPNNTITTHPQVIKKLLLIKELPPFNFLVCKN
jgi:hypothetical protein